MFDRPAAKIVGALLGGFTLLCAGFFLGKGASGPAPSPIARETGPVVVKHEPAQPRPGPEPDPHAGTYSATHAGHDDHHEIPPEIPHHDAHSPDSRSHLENPRDLNALLAGLRGAVAEGDPNAMTLHQNAILQFTRGDERRALEVIAAFGKEDAASVLDILASAIASDPSFAANARIQDAFLAIAEGQDELAARRQSAFYFLAQAYRVPPPLQDRVAALARGENDPSLQSGAIQALGHFARSDESRTAAVNSQLVEVARSAADPMIRANALSALQAKASDDRVLADTAELLRSDRDSEVRRAAAEALGGAPVQGRFVALTELERAYRGESAPEVKRTILMSIVRAGRAEAVTTLEKLLSADAVLARDVQDYLDILKGGETDTARVFEEKARRGESR